MPYNNGWVCQHGHCPDKLLHNFHFSDTLNTGEANTNRGEIWQMQHHDLLFLENLEFLLSVIPNRNHIMMMIRDAPHSVQHIVDDSSVRTPVHIVPNRKDNHYQLKQYTYLGLYNNIY